MSESGEFIWSGNKSKRMNLETGDNSPGSWKTGEGNSCLEKGIVAWKIRMKPARVLVVGYLGKFDGLGWGDFVHLWKIIKLLDLFVNVL